MKKKIGEEENRIREEENRIRAQIEAQIEAQRRANIRHADIRIAELVHQIRRRILDIDIIESEIIDLQKKINLYYGVGKRGQNLGEIKDKIFNNIIKKLEELQRELQKENNSARILYDQYEALQEYRNSL